MNTVILSAAKDLVSESGFFNARFAGTRLGMTAASCSFLAVLGMTVFAARLQAQMRVTGRVTSGDQNVQGASVGIPELGITSRTNSEGQYSFLIRSAQVRGQNVSLVARHSRYGQRSVQIVLGGGSVEQDFVLSVFERPSTPEAAAAVRPQIIAGRSLDGAAFAGIAGPLDVVSALAGQIPGLTVTGASGPGASARMIFRGPRSISVSAQPLVVVDGVVVDNKSSSIAAQQFGLGGFDYGTPLQDIAIDDIASVKLIDAASAAPLYGSRAANGVLVITTRQAVAGGLQLSFATRYSGDATTRLPSYQNRYGQGLGGQFEFFDGRGGGINDATDQSWGPALDGQPIAQASLTEPRRPDVRYWLPHSSGVRDYFESARTVDANIAIQGARQIISGRAALNLRDANGLTPNTALRRIGLTLHGVAHPSSRFSASANLQVIGTNAENRPGTGFDEVNPVAGFTRMGRQVDLDVLRSPITTGAANDQINWIYTERNNPFFQAFKNSNDDSRTLVLGGGALRYAIGRGLSATLNANAYDSRDERNVDVVRGWKGKYPTAIGRRDFSDGGSERQSLDFDERVVNLGVSSAPRRAFGADLSGTAGIERRSNTFRAAIGISDTAVVDTTESGENDVTAFYLLGSLTRSQTLFVDAGARIEQSSTFPSDFGFAVFPSVAVMYDVAQAIPALRTGLRLGTARLRGSWWRAGNELTPRDLLRTYAGGGTYADPALGVNAGSGALPERTGGLELTSEIASANNRVALDASIYRERSSELLIATPIFTGQSAEISNNGFELQLRTVPLSGTFGGRQSTWELRASLARNTNRVEKLTEGLDDVALGPSLWGTFLVARTGEPLGAILGTRYLRDSASNALVLKDGLPIADDALQVLGSTQPDWTTSVRNSIRFGSTEISLLVDGRIGGKIFSATNLWGSYAGTLKSTLEGRENGLTITGIDTVTRAENTTTVTAEDYFHSLAAIHEAWVYDASYWKLRDARITYALPLRFVPGFREHILRASLIGRNIMTSAKAPNIDPETALSTGVFQGFEMGQLPGTRSIGFQITIAP